MAKRCEVVYIPGNHDDGARQFATLAFGGVRIAKEAIHETADGHRLLVLHGDQFDLIVQHSPMLSNLGGWAYDWLVVVNRYYNKFRRWFGLPYSSMSQAIKLKVKAACKYVSRFEQTVETEARRRGLDGVVCGHVHQPEARMDAIAYFNCGDWVENGTVVVEHPSGKMEVIDALAALADLEWRKSLRKLSPPAPVPPALMPGPNRLSDRLTIPLDRRFEEPDTRL
jgi:UDP-2,3-diacylglucosamine pyrophosphatase LpxH